MDLVSAHLKMMFALTILKKHSDLTVVQLSDLLKAVAIHLRSFALIAELAWLEALPLSLEVELQVFDLKSD